MSTTPETVLRRVRNVVGTGGVERLDPGGVRLLLGELLFNGNGVPDWHSRAACSDSDPDLFFPDTGAREQITAAKQICAGCPVRAECLADVVAWEPPSYRNGIAGGLTAQERRQLWQHHRRQDGGAAA